MQSHTAFPSSSTKFPGRWEDERMRAKETIGSILLPQNRTLNSLPMWMLRYEKFLLLIEKEAGLTG